MACSDEDHGRSRRPGIKDRGWSHRSGTRLPGDREVGWRCVRSVPFTWRRGAQVCWLSLKTKVNVLWVVWPQNHSDYFFWFDLKPGGDGFLWVGLKIGGSGFPVWASKPAALVWWFGPKNDCDGFLVWASKSSGLQFISCATKPMEGGWRGAPCSLVIAHDVFDEMSKRQLIDLFGCCSLTRGFAHIGWCFHCDCIS
jgi:hypothetical protein